MPNALSAVDDIQNYAQNIVDTVREPLLILDATLRVQSANRTFYQTFHVSPGETEGRLIYELGNGQWDIPDLRTLLEDIVPKSSVFDDFELEHTFPDIGRRVMLLNARKLQAGQHGELLVLAMEDVTARRQAEEALVKAGALQSAIFNSANFSSIATDAKGVFASARDVTERSRLEKQMQNQAAELSDLHRRKDEFLAMLSHELRSPLAPIVNAVQMLGLQKGTESLVQRQSRAIIERQMAQLQHLVDDLLEVSRITTGVVQLRRIPVTYRPDIMLLDIGLPGLNGYEVAKQIRQHAELKHVVLVALTGYGQDSDRQASGEAGFTHHIVKPARFEELQKILATVAEQVA